MDPYRVLVVVHTESSAKSTTSYIRPTPPPRTLSRYFAWHHSVQASPGLRADAASRERKIVNHNFALSLTAQISGPSSVRAVGDRGREKEGAWRTIASSAESRWLH